ncbi:MAG: hypothetical protein P9M14_07120 [Candidatus Alcyoniella australis]|nr:hypothetical protein [Candidatus Alcyoniella australis]
MQIACTQCGGQVPIEPDSDFLSCPYCNTSLFVDLRGSVHHLAIEPLVPPDQALQTLMDFLRDHELPRPKSIDSKLIYLPFWQIQWPHHLASMVAGHLPQTGLLEPALPPGTQLGLDRCRIDPGDLTLPGVQLDAALEAFSESQPDYQNFKSARLVHAPFHLLAFSLSGNEHHALVDAVTGAIYIEGLPSAASTGRTVRSMLMVSSIIVLATLVVALAPRTIFGIAALVVLGYPLTMLFRYGLRR